MKSPLFASNTAIALALEEVKTYLNGHKAADTYKSCRQKFVILLTDGGDTKYCDGNGDGNQPDQYKRRRASVLRAKELADAGYKVFVIGLSSALEPLLIKTLNWMAYYGGTDNPLVANSGNGASLNTGYFAADPCMTEPDSRLTGQCDGFSNQCFVTLNDPGYINQPLDGYAFFSSSSEELEAALRQAINTIQHQSYAFSQSSVASSRVADENFIYEASFQPNLADSVLDGAPGEVPDQRRRQRRRDGSEKRRHAAAAQGRGNAIDLDVQGRLPRRLQHDQYRAC